MKTAHGRARNQERRTGVGRTVHTTGSDHQLSKNRTTAKTRAGSRGKKHARTVPHSPGHRAELHSPLRGNSRSSSCESSARKTAVLLRESLAATPLVAPSLMAPSLVAPSLAAPLLVAPSLPAALASAGLPPAALASAALPLAPLLLTALLLAVSSASMEHASPSPKLLRSTSSLSLPSSNGDAPGTQSPSPSPSQSPKMSARSDLSSARWLATCALGGAWAW